MRVAGLGFEITSKSSENVALSETGDAKSDVICTQSDDADPALSLLAHAWPALSLADRKAILAIVRRASGKGVQS
jgi:hypothetical protein